MHFHRLLPPALHSARKKSRSTSKRLVNSKDKNAVKTSSSTSPRGRQCLHNSSSSSTVVSSTLMVSTILPDPTASAAGVRTMSLLDGLSTISSKVHMATAATTISGPSGRGDDNHRPQHAASTTRQTKSSMAASTQEIIQDLSQRNISWSCLSPNRSEQVQDLTHQLLPQHIDRILFDRFYVEESFSFALRKEYPDASLVLDMQDMHALRSDRESLVIEWDAKYSPTTTSSTDRGQVDCFGVLPAVMDHIPSTESDKLLRELGSIHRCDLTLVCSPYELRLLATTYGVDASKLCLAPFFVDPTQIQSIDVTTPSTSIYDDHDDNASPPSFVFCGGFKHTPNVDAVRVLLQFLWPAIRKQLPSATLHIHGAYCADHMFRQLLKNPVESGVYIHGYTADLEDVFRQGSILLAPLRFGAGLKGKIIDAWSFGLPVVTTPVGSEGFIGMENEDTSTTSFGGAVAWSVDEFVHSALELALERSSYVDAVRRGQAILQRTQDKGINWAKVEGALTTTEKELLGRRKQDYTRALLWHHGARSTEYFSRWIELKEKIRKEDESARCKHTLHSLTHNKR